MFLDDDHYRAQHEKLEREILSGLAHITKQLTNLGDKMALTQADIDALTAKVAAQDTTLQQIATQVTALQAANPSLDLAALTAIITKAGTDTATIETELTPAPVVAPTA